MPVVDQLKSDVGMCTDVPGSSNCPTSWLRTVVCVYIYNIYIYTYIYLYVYTPDVYTVCIQLYIYMYTHLFTVYAFDVFHLDLSAKKGSPMQQVVASGCPGPNIISAKGTRHGGRKCVRRVVVQGENLIIP